MLPRCLDFPVWILSGSLSRIRPGGGSADVILAGTPFASSSGAISARPCLGVGLTRSVILRREKGGGEGFFSFYGQGCDTCNMESVALAAPRASPLRHFHR